jgi:hypothetical protein
MPRLAPTIQQLQAAGCESLRAKAGLEIHERVTGSMAACFMESVV